MDAASSQDRIEAEAEQELIEDCHGRQGLKEVLQVLQTQTPRHNFHIHIHR